MILIVAHATIPHHRHHIGKHRPRALVLVRIHKNAQPVEIIPGPEHFARLRPLLRQPDGHAVPVQVALPVDLELHFHLPVVRRHRHAGEEPASLALSVRCEADVLVRADDGVLAELEVAGLHVGVEVGGLEGLGAELSLREFLWANVCVVYEVGGKGGGKGLKLPGCFVCCSHSLLGWRRVRPDTLSRATAATLAPATPAKASWWFTWIKGKQDYESKDMAKTGDV